MHKLNGISRAKILTHNFLFNRRVGSCVFSGEIIWKKHPPRDISSKHANRPAQHTSVNAPQM
jgi:hypothetical protein